MPGQSDSSIVVLDIWQMITLLSCLVTIFFGILAAWKDRQLVSFRRDLLPHVEGLYKNTQSVRRLIEEGKTDQAAGAATAAGVEALAVQRVVAGPRKTGRGQPVGEANEGTAAASRPATEA